VLSLPFSSLQISCWYAFNGVGTAFGGLLGFAIGNIKGALQSWRYEFLVIGAVCAAWGLAILLMLPSSPATSIWLTRDERLMAVARLRKNQVSLDFLLFRGSRNFFSTSSSADSQIT